MQIRNNYDKEVFNGDIGRIKRIDQENQVVLVSYDGCDIPYDYPDLDELSWPSPLIVLICSSTID